MTASDAAIAHVSSAHPWTDNRIHYRECTSLAAAGYEVTLVAVEPAVAAAQDAVTVVPIPRRKRLKRMIVSTVQAVWIAWRSGAKVIHLHDPELVWAVPVLRLAGRKVVFDAHEDLPADVLNKPYIPHWARPVLVGVAYLVVWLAGRAHRVVAATESIAERFPEAKTIIVHNYPPLVEDEVSGNLDDREDIAAYIGAMSEIRGTRQLLESIRAEAFPEHWGMEIAGTATAEVAEQLNACVADERLTYHAQLPPLEARGLLMRAKVGVVPFQDTPAHREALPTKMFEYFAAGLPVIASDFPLWRTIIAEHECGLLVDTTNPESIAEAIAFYAQRPDTWRAHSLNARRLAVEQLNWAPEGQRLVALYRDLVD